jgi:cholesterol transport system auxiliary component
MPVQILLRLILVGLAIALGSCSFSRPAPAKQSFLLQASRPDGMPPALVTGSRAATVKVLPFSVAAPFQGKGFVYRDGNLRFESDYYNEWFTAPAAMLTERTAAWLAKSAVFGKVLPATSALDGAFELEGIVTELYGDYRDAASTQAVLTVQFHLTDAANSKLYYDRLIRETIPFSDRSPEALARSVDAALGKTLTQLEADLRQISLPGQ